MRSTVRSIMSAFSDINAMNPKGSGTLKMSKVRKSFKDCYLKNE